MKNIRASAVAGLFYPQSGAVLAAQIGRFMQQPLRSKLPPPKAIISPHAGYIYSGQLASEVFSLIKPNSATIKRVVVLGPSHRVGFSGIASSNYSSYQTPLGEIPIDRIGLENLEDLSFVSEINRAHELEHSLEVQLPFIQSIVPNFSLIPLVVGDTSPEQVSEVLFRLWGTDETLVVISSDLSHYHPYHEARKLDDITARTIANFSYRELNSDMACGARSITGLLKLVEKFGLEEHTLGLVNSGDTAGDKERVVGYGGFLFYEKDRLEGERLGDLLIPLARKSIEAGLQGSKLKPNGLHPALKYPGAAFVTLKLNGKLRGCIGSLQARNSIGEDVINNAYHAAFNDHRFTRLSAEEYDGIELKISILTPPTALDFDSEEDLLTKIRPGIDGLILQNGRRQGTFLPTVWEQLPAPQDFLAHLKAKAGLPADFWSDSIQVSRYTALELG